MLHINIVYVFDGSMVKTAPSGHRLDSVNLTSPCITISESAVLRTVYIT